MENESAFGESISPTGAPVPSNSLPRKTRPCGHAVWPGMASIWSASTSSISGLPRALWTAARTIPVPSMRNSSTGRQYRNEPAIAIVEILNENGIGQGHNPPSKFYADELDQLYNTWLKTNLTPEQLQKVRSQAGVADDALIPRLAGNARATAPKERYEIEV